MSNQRDDKELVQLERVNELLTVSLERCRLLLADCRSKLAGNDPGEAEESSVRRRGGRNG